ncbi:hypothetical protein IKG20_00045 [Candidatus Saccharibacteria bacterium]|nr:hypothetical protein [Candidatus Saccharibacteria bacterium]
MKIGMLGAGAYGSAIADVLRENGHKVKFYDPYRLPDSSLADVVERSQVLFIATPAEVVSGLIKQMPPVAFERPLIILTKGVMDLKVWEDFRYYEIVSGPGFAEEIKRKKRTKLTVAAHGAFNGTTLAEDLLSNSYIKLDKTDDVLGVALLSGLKNIYAIESGRRGLSFGSADFKEYLTEVARECEQFLLHNGGFMETVRLSAGLGDLVLTCGSEESRNYSFGKLLGGRRKILERKRLVRRYLRETTVEGIFAAKAIDEYDLFVPKENEILENAVRRIKNATKR